MLFTYITDKGSCTRAIYLLVTDEVEKVLNLAHGNMLFHELSVVVKQVRDGLLGKQIITNLTLHKAKVLGDHLLGDEGGKVAWLAQRIHIKGQRGRDAPADLILAVVGCKLPDEHIRQATDFLDPGVARKKDLPDRIQERAVALVASGGLERSLRRAGA